MFTTADEVLSYIRDEGVQFVDVRFCDLPGVMQHFTVPARSVDEDFFTDGQMFDGSSIRGFQAIHESDMQLIPDPATAFVDPFRAAKTLAMNFSIVDPFTKEKYSRDPRNIAAKAEAYLKESGIADTVYFGPEAEFYVFDDVRFETKQNAGYYYIDSIEGAWNTGRVEDGGNRGYKTRYKGGYFPVPPVDHYADLRDSMVTALGGVGIEVERAHHEVGTAGQAEINYRFDSLLHAGDSLMLFKYVIKNIAWAARQDRDLHAQADLRRQRLRHALPPVAVEGRLAALLRRARLRRPVRHRPLVHRRPAQARAVAARLHQPDGEQLPPAGPRLRGPGQPGLLPAQPLRRGPDPGHRDLAEGEAAGVPGAGPVLQPVPGLLRAADGRPGRHPDQDRAADADRQGPLRAAPGRARRHPAPCPARCPRCSTRSRPTTATCSRAASSPRT